MKANVLYMRPKLLTTTFYDIMLNLGCDCGVCFSNTRVARIVKKHGRPKKLVPSKNMGGFIGCVKTLVLVGWSIEIQLTWMACPSNMLGGCTVYYV